MAKAVKKYKGGVHSLIEAAVRGDGALFCRYQNKTMYGYRWSAWVKKGRLDVLNLPGTITAGFSELFPVDCYTDFACRLPNH